MQKSPFFGMQNSPRLPAPHNSDRPPISLRSTVHNDQLIARRPTWSPQNHHFHDIIDLNRSKIIIFCAQNRSFTIIRAFISIEMYHKTPHLSPRQSWGCSPPGARHTCKHILVILVCVYTCRRLIDLSRTTAYLNCQEFCIKNDEIFIRNDDLCI